MILLSAITIIIAILIVLFLIFVYNQLTKSRILLKEAWSGIGTFLQQRNDVIPSLVEIVKGYVEHENKTLVEVTKWRNKSAMATSPAEQSEASAGLNKALLDFYQVSEQYPELKANENFMHLQNELTEIEVKLNNSRRYYNGTVREYNQQRAVFPQNIIASLFNFLPEEFFEEEESAKIAPKINF
ncbi:MAG TPA: LemA family protein [Chitinophagales bacterium]|nr:LemA family protein [Chitinophagales bacterium]HMU97463.1 LemA family protein [Chitinophagales bacterium]